MRATTALAFAVGAVAAIGVGWLVLEQQDAPLDRTEVETIVAEYLQNTPEAVEAVAANYLRENPDAVVDALRAFQQRENARQTAEVRQKVEQIWPQLAQAEGDPVLGNPDAPLTLVEFFDYRCGYCKKVAGEVLALVEERDDVRIVLKEFPILGPASVLAATASLAASEQPGFQAFHEGLINMPGEPTEERIWTLAENVGLDVAQLRADMADPAVAQKLEENYALAKELGINGTPAFVVSNELIPGAVDKATLIAALEDSRTD